MTVQSNQQLYRTFTRRAAMLGGAQLVLLGSLAARMYYLQVVESDRYKLLAEENRISLRLLAPRRGRILDRFGQPLATNDQNYRIVLTPEQTEDLEGTLQSLETIVSISDSERARIMKEVGRSRAFVPVTVKENLDWPLVAQVEVNTPDLPGVSIEVEQRRNYPYGGMVSHVLGYVGVVAEAELTGDPLLELPGFRVGKSGIEKQYDTDLRGSAGNSQVEVNAVGRVIRELARDEGVPGKDLVTTLDMGLQTFTQQSLSAQLSGAAVCIDIMTGEILALASTPSYDPTAFDRGLTSAEWQALTTDPLRPLSNKALNGTYAPGSTFKTVVAMAAMEQGIGPDHTVFCNGVTVLGSARFHCWKKQGHGTLDMIGGIRHSCDSYFYDLARRIGIDPIAAMARRFGLGQLTGIDMPSEKPGLIPDRAWKQATMGDIWHPGESLVAGIGQGFITTTPLQLAVLTARLSSGGYAIQPKLHRDMVFAADGGAALREGDSGSVLKPPFPSMGVSPEHLAVVLEGMNQVSNATNGTAYRARITIPGMELAGKTGTAQVRRITMSERNAGVRKNEDLPWPQRDHALFIGFAPVHAPRYAVAVVIEHGGGGSVIAGPIARDILIEAQTRDPARRRPAEQMVQNNERPA
ncbi:penicillin-binding protein 2 [Hypericibacter sp.]|uniref:penicillin-binding protein 2 n=1 Tax=Hypericibacter sp. TaxID=2705401 RepID=UPI003D6C8944